MDLMLLFGTPGGFEWLIIVAMFLFPMIPIGILIVLVVGFQRKKKKEALEKMDNDLSELKNVSDPD